MTTPRKGSPVKNAIDQAADILGENMGEGSEGGPVPAEFRVQINEPAAPRAVKAKKEVERITIVLEDNDDIPPGGQFIGVDGVGFKLQSGVEAKVPRAILEVLDAAVMSVPVKNAEHQVIGYRDRLRFPYRIVTATRGA